MVADIQARLKSMQFKGEILRRNTNHTAGDRVRQWGYYLQSLYEFGKYYLVCRAGRYDTSHGDDHALARVTAGIGWYLNGGFRLSLEHQFGRRVSDIALAQLVFGF
jgi:hypothetical protein